MVRRGQGGRLEPYRYMLKRAFLRLSPEEQRAPPPPEDDETAVVLASSKAFEAAEHAGDIAADEAAADVAADVAGFDMAPCGVEPLPEESADSSLDAPPPADMMSVMLASPGAPMLASWRAAVAA